MRSVWRMLFWFADGGWTSRTSVTSHSATSMRALELAQQKLENISATMLARGVSPIPESFLQPQTTTSASVGDIMAIIPAILEPFSATFNATIGESMVWRIFTDFFHSIGLHMTSSLPESPFTNVTTSVSAPKSTYSGPPSLLGDIGFLRNLTRWPAINKMVISVLEGQIITVLVVVCFILIFLIREWVVQQQPGINMGAGFNAEFALPGRGQDHEVQDEGHDDHLGPDPPNDFHEFDLPDREQERDPIPVADRRIAQPRRRIVRFEDEIIREEPEQEQTESPLSDNRSRTVRPHEEIREERDHNELPVPYDAGPLRNAIARRAQPQRSFPEAPGSPGTAERPQDHVRAVRLNRRRHAGAPEIPPQRPGMPTRDALSPAAAIQRGLEEAERLQRQKDPEHQLAVAEFLSIYRRAEGNPEEVLHIIAAQNKEERLKYWVRAMQNIQEAATARTSKDSLTLLVNSNDINEHWVDVPAPLQLRTSSNIESQVEASQSHASSSNEAEETTNSKGKGKAVDSPGLINSSLLPDLRGTWSFPTNEEDSSLLESEDSQKLYSKEQLPHSTEISSFAPNRPRASSDGPQFRENSIVAYNTWEFPSNFPQSVDSKENHSNDGASASSPRETWKEAQDMRVQEAVSKAREQHARKRSNSHDLSAEESQVEQTNVEFENLIHLNREISEEHDVPPPAESDDGNSLEVITGSVDGDGDTRNDGISDISSGDVLEEDSIFEAPEPNPLHPDDILPPEQDPLVRPQEEPVGILGHIADWLWGDMGQHRDENLGNDEHVVQDIAAEAPFVPVANALNRDLRAEAEQAEQNLEVLEAAIAAGIDPNDPDALDEAEEFDGIMELIGMRGPLTGLLQNGMFSAVLISLTVSCGIWIPYNFGRLVLLLLAHPLSTAKLPLKLVFSSAELLIDVSLVAIGLISYLILCIAALPAALVSIASASVGSPTFITVSTFGSQAWQIAVEACSRITGGFLSNVRHIADSEVPAFSATSHESLLILKSWVYNSITWLVNMLIMILSPKFVADLGRQVWDGSLAASIRDKLSSVPALLLDPSSWIITLNIPRRMTPLDPELANWSGVDRFWAIFAGYAALSILGALYLRRGAPFSTGRTGKEYEAHVADLLNQAGGVMKVILIISIEMLVFPLYCGLLLDLALLPLFEDATFMSRMFFTLNSPLTSMFVHWFVGTCYMFHFALFVSMCRKIMRNGVLCKSLYPCKSLSYTYNQYRLHSRSR